MDSNGIDIQIANKPGIYCLPVPAAIGQFQHAQVLSRPPPNVAFAAA